MQSAEPRTLVTQMNESCRQMPSSAFSGDVPFIFQVNQRDEDGEKDKDKDNKNSNRLSNRHADRLIYARPTRMERTSSQQDDWDFPTRTNIPLRERVNPDLLRNERVRSRVENFDRLQREREQREAQRVRNRQREASRLLDASLRNRPATLTATTTSTTSTTDRRPEVGINPMLITDTTVPSTDRGGSGDAPTQIIEPVRQPSLDPINPEAGLIDIDGIGDLFQQELGADAGISTRTTGRNSGLIERGRTVHVPNDRNMTPSEVNAAADALIASRRSQAANNAANSSTISRPDISSGTVAPINSGRTMTADSIRETLQRTTNELEELENMLNISSWPSHNHAATERLWDPRIRRQPDRTAPTRMERNELSNESPSTSIPERSIKKKTYIKTNSSDTQNLKIQNTNVNLARSFGLFIRECCNVLNQASFTSGVDLKLIEELVEVVDEKAEKTWAWISSCMDMLESQLSFGEKQIQKLGSSAAISSPSSSSSSSSNFSSHPDLEKILNYLGWQFKDQLSDKFRNPRHCLDLHKLSSQGKHQTSAFDDGYRDTNTNISANKYSSSGQIACTSRWVDRLVARQDNISYALSLMRQATDEHGDSVPVVLVSAFKHLAYVVDSYILWRLKSYEICQRFSVPKHRMEKTENGPKRRFFKRSNSISIPGTDYPNLLNETAENSLPLATHPGLLTTSATKSDLFCASMSIDVENDGEMGSNLNLNPFRHHFQHQSTC